MMRQASLISTRKQNNQFQLHTPMILKHLEVCANQNPMNNQNLKGKRKGMNILADIQQWYIDQCNGDWEHQFGIVIETLDNPGWSMTVDLIDTTLLHKPFTEVAVERDGQDWMFCKVESNQFKGSCGPKNLTEMLTLFHDWLKS
jgi:hypothetical protein